MTTLSRPRWKSVTGPSCHLFVRPRLLLEPVRTIERVDRFRELQAVDVHRSPIDGRQLRRAQPHTFFIGGDSRMADSRLRRRPTACAEVRRAPTRVIMRECDPTAAHPAAAPGPPPAAERDRAPPRLRGLGRRPSATSRRDAARRFDLGRLLQALRRPGPRRALAAARGAAVPCVHGGGRRGRAPDASARATKSASVPRAEDALAHRVRLLGTETVELGAGIDWLRDFRVRRGVAAPLHARHRLRESARRERRQGAVGAVAACNG